MAPIRVLPPALVAQIAAGEVVERPASMLKELVENALDAGATCIQVAATAGGIDGLTVQDNGSGIPRDELLLARTPHATSKLHASEQLMRIESLGFRGEALASMAAVSHLVISARCPHEEHGWRLEPEHTEPQPCAHAPGTCVQVSDLFHTIPARKKFLKTPKTEWLKLKETFVRMALSHPECAMKLVHEGNTVLEVPGSTFEDRKRLATLMGQGLAQDALPVRKAMMDLKLFGFVCSPQGGRSLSDRQAVFLNGRWLKDKVVQHAIQRAYEGLLPPGACPAYVLFLEMPADEVDVNVHPAKHEVRFVAPARVHAFVESALHETLSPHKPEDTHTDSSHVAGRWVDRSSGASSMASATSPLLVQAPPAPQAILAYAHPFAIGSEEGHLVVWHVRQAWQAWRRSETAGCACSLSVAVRTTEAQGHTLQAWGWRVQCVGHSTLVQERPQEIAEHHVAQVLQACVTLPKLTWEHYADAVPFKGVVHALRDMNRMGPSVPLTSERLAQCWER